MRKFNHWTPRYIKARLDEMAYHKDCPEHPWLTKNANQILASYLQDSDIGLEFGSGRSTLWLAKHSQRLTSVEHDKAWYLKVCQMLEVSKQNNVDYHIIPMDAPEEKGADASYVRFVDKFSDNTFDFILIDGIYRGFCALNVLYKVKPGGMIIIDNVNWFLPSASNSPNSRTFSEGAKGDTWKKFQELTSNWRKIWTSSGVSDTAFFFKPFV
jgi:predicted O-methyltransferase YrrM